jgi:hypothetical protein
MSGGSSLVRGLAVTVSLICATLAALSPRVAKAATDDDPRDEIRLRDGRTLGGRIVDRSLGRWLVIETDDGRRHTLAWDTIEEIDDAAAPRAVTMPAAVRDAWRKRSGAGATYELRANLSTIALPGRTFGLEGFCSTGSETAPASMYGQTAHDGGLGFGGGVGGRLGFMYRSRLDPEGASSWWGFRGGLGLDLHAYRMRSPVGIPAVHGDLCSTVAKDTHELAYGSSVHLLAHVPLFLGGLVAIGKLDETRWRGIVLGAAWSPAVMHFGMFSSVSTSYINPLGLELTLDFTTLHAVPHARPEAHLRLSVFYAPHTTASHPAIGTLSLGAVWY